MGRDRRTARGTGLLPLLGLHDEIDRQVSDLARRHAERLACRRGCSDCCVDGLTVFEIEAERIRAAHADLLQRDRPHAPGACALLDGTGGCRIYADRPYVCRTQGLPLRWTESAADGATVEYRDICPLNENEQAPLEILDAADCWTLGDWESRLAELQLERQPRGTRPRRVALRDLFRGAAGQNTRR